MAASGSIVDVPMLAVATVNSVSIPAAETSYELMTKILKDNEAPLIFASLPISASAIIEGLSAYEMTLINCRVAYEKIGLKPPKA